MNDIYLHPCHDIECFLMEVRIKACTKGSVYNDLCLWPGCLQGTSVRHDTNIADKTYNQDFVDFSKLGFQFYQIIWCNAKTWLADHKDLAGSAGGADGFLSFSIKLPSFCS